jgi:hypothetical protein
LQAGAGGTGKTRLAIDVCETLAKEGWFAGFLPAGLDKDDVERELHALLEPGRDCLVVIDYAETRADVVVALARQLLIEVERLVKVEAPRCRFRIVMLAREGGDWFNQLAERATRSSDEALKALLTAGATKSGPHRMSVRPIAVNERRQIFQSALNAFAAKTGQIADSVIEPNLDEARFERVLMIQMAALAELRKDTVGVGQDLLDNTLGHERRYWRKLLGLGEEETDDGQLQTFEQSLALITLLSGRESDSAAKAAIARVPRLQEQGPDARLSMFDRLRDFYPNRKTDGDASTDGIRGLEPDLLGERLVADCLERDKELLDAALDPKRRSNADDARAAFTLLARLAMQRERDKTHLERALSHYFATWTKEILTVAKETGGPIGDLMAEATRHAPPKIQRSIVKVAKGAVAEDTANLKSFGVAVDERNAEAIRTGHRFKKMSRGDLVKLYSVLLVLQDRHFNNDEQREAAEKAEQAHDVAQQLAKTSKPEDLLRLANAKAHWSFQLSRIGRFAEALIHSRTAEDLVLTLHTALSGQANWRENYGYSVEAHARALDNNGQFEDSLSKSREALQIRQSLAPDDSVNSRAIAGLHVTLSSAHLAVGEYEAGLREASNAEDISQELATDDPDADKELRASSLLCLSQCLSNLGEFKDARQKAELSAQLYDELANQQPDRYASELSQALTTLSIQCRDLSDFGQALDNARRAEFIGHHLAERQPEAYHFTWVISLANLGEALLNTGDFAEAIIVTAQAVRLISSLPPRPGNDNQRIAPGFCRRVLAEARLANDEPDIALEVAETGAASLREAFADRPHHVAEHYAQGLATLAKCHRALSNDQAAANVLTEGITGITPFFEKRPRALQREMLRLIEPLDTIGPEAARQVPDDVRAELAKLPELPRGGAGL